MGSTRRARAGSTSTAARSASSPGPAASGGLLEAKAIIQVGPPTTTCAALAESNAIPLSRVDEVLGSVGAGRKVAPRSGPGKFALGMGQRLGSLPPCSVTPDGPALRRAGQRLGPEGIRGSAPFALTGGATSDSYRVVRNRARLPAPISTFNRTWR